MLDRFPLAIELCINGVSIFNAFALYIVSPMWANVHYRKQAERLRMKGIRAAEKAAREAENVKKKAEYAKRKRGTHSNHRLIIFMN